MKFRKKKEPKQETPLEVGAWQQPPRPVRKAFPGSASANEPLRVAFEARAYADLLAHARVTLDHEVCGVLAGVVGEDENGVFVHVQAIVEGNAARSGSAHVTFTQGTWNQIHSRMERDYPKLSIVGWYHTHPGFGVAFSDMDTFIHTNFFPLPTQLAFLTDPLSGEVAVAVNRAGKTVLLRRFWVDGREVRCRSGLPDVAENTADAAPEQAASLKLEMERLETRMNQLIQSVEQQQASNSRMSTVLFTATLTLMVFVLGFTLYRNWIKVPNPPEVNQYVPIPITVGDKTVMLGVAVMEWQVPPELDAMMTKVAREKAAQILRNEAERLEKEQRSEADSQTPQAPKEQQ